MVNEVNCLPAPNNTIYLPVGLHWPKDTLKSILLPYTGSWQPVSSNPIDFGLIRLSD
jgi:hypothetical protein